MSDWMTLLTDAETDVLDKAAPPSRPQPMLATLTHDYFSDPDWIFERKLDGERIVSFRHGTHARLRTRNDKDAGAAYPEITEALEEQPCDDFVADGEVVAFEGDRTSFSRLQQRMQASSADEARKSGVAVYYYLFDLLYLDGYSLESLPLRTRKKLLKSVISFNDPLRFTRHRNETGEAFHKEACEKGWEGIIAKKADAPYAHSRSRSWLKFKCTRGQELVVGGFTEPEGNRIGFGALLLGYFEDGKLCYAGRVGTGFDEDTLRSLHGRLKDLSIEDNPFAEEISDGGVTFVEPELVAEVGFTEWTRAGRLRHPRFLGLRRDKPAGEVVREPQ